MGLRRNALRPASLPGSDMSRFARLKWLPLTTEGGSKAQRKRATAFRGGGATEALQSNAS